MRRIVTILIGLFAPLLSCEVEAKVLLTCGDMAGNSYFVAGGVVPRKSSGWRPDSVSPGRILLIADDTGKVSDVRMQDAAGWFSYAKDGCSIAPISSGKQDTFIIVAVCPLSVDSFMFLSEGQPQLIFSQLKSAPAITKGTIMTAKCKFGE